jgi:copper transport protein
MALTGPLAAVALGHAELVISNPPAGAVLADPPGEIRLVFSEPIEAGFSTLDVTTPGGGAILTAAGSPDPADDDVLLARLPPIGEGVYTVVWRVLSKVDGHAEVGSYSFAVATAGASVAPIPDAAPGEPPTTGHHGTLETQGRTLLYGGLLLAFGLAIVAWLVLEPTVGSIPSAAGRAIGIGLLTAGVGATLMLLASGLGLTGPSGRPDLVGYATTSRPGILLLARVAIGILGGLLVIALVRGRRVEPAIEVGALAATTCIGLTVAAGHAAVFEPPVTIGVWFVHVSAAGIWLAGLAVVAILASRRPPDEKMVRSVVRRYSALALVAVGLVILTGAYQTWVENEGLPSLDDPYGRLLVVKLAVAAIVLGLGFVNYLGGGRIGGRLGGLGRRATVETFLAGVVLVVTAALVAVPPPGPGGPVELARAGSDESGADVTLAIGPGRPGPNRFTAVTSGGGVPDVLRLETPAGAAVAVDFRPGNAGDAASAQPFVADVGDLGAMAWNAVVVLESGATASFPFVLTPEGVAAGRAVPPVDLGLVLGLTMVFLGVGAAAFARAGGTFPRVDLEAARIALTGGGLSAAAAGVLIVAFGPRF